MSAPSPNPRANPRSPTPSVRPISRRRVHERSGLLSKIDSGQIYDSQTDDEAASINYRSYTPAAASALEDLEWSDLLPYYLPFLSWISTYNLRYLLGDLVGGLTLVFFQLPLSLSYATMAHVPVISGLYSLAIAPLIYMVFGSVPQMVVGPEAPISLVVGQAVEPLLHHAKKKNLDPMEYVSTITFVSGASLLGFGLGRLGFLDNVLCPALLKGFIAAVGFVMLINSSINILGLEELMKEISDDPDQMDIHSPFDKLCFLAQNLSHFNPLSFKIGAIGFAIIMVTRMLKSKSTDKRVILLPEILIVVSGATVLCQIYQWDKRGLDVIGAVKNSEELTLYNPIGSWKLIKKFATSGFVCAMLGFFESTTASKSLGSSFDLPISSNRELVALGSINIFGSIFGALPAFGGYGRSKINAISAKTTTSGAIMGLLTLVTIKFLLRYLYYVPICMLSGVIAVIGVSLIEEAPYELYFHWRNNGVPELITFALTVVTTLFFSMEGGIAVGIIFSLIRVIKNSTDSRIQILGRVPNSNTFVDADIPLPETVAPGVQLNMFDDSRQTQVNCELLEEIEGCLIIKIPEPLSFTNSSDLLMRLRRVEIYGSAKAHPASKRSRDTEMSRYVIFDLNNMTSIDSSAAKTVAELLTNYQRRSIRSMFVNVSPQVRKTIDRCGIRDLLEKDLYSLKYFEIQGLNSNNEAINRCQNLLENGEPYFQHISDVLKLIDCFESNNGEV
ncbi:uncharacterized protein LODBEIA_P12490 [Lodderomyces beijingensis]|uniref:STAS domain-containing protein n=1 Tax=Lodderomyces beijingensis TaxID=1775926 RepID=A0ABP0ZIL1_9ASCO